jgi:hypothetical protein
MFGRRPNLAGSGRTLPARQGNGPRGERGSVGGGASGRGQRNLRPFSPSGRTSAPLLYRSWAAGHARSLPERQRELTRHGRPRLGRRLRREAEFRQEPSSRLARRRHFGPSHRAPAPLAVPQNVKPRRRYRGNQAEDQFFRRKHDRARAVFPDTLESELGDGDSRSSEFGQTLMSRAPRAMSDFLRHPRNYLRPRRNFIGGQVDETGASKATLLPFRESQPSGSLCAGNSVTRCAPPQLVFFALSHGAPSWARSLC